MQRLRTLLAWILAWGFTSALAAEGVPYATDLARDAGAARAIRGVVLVVFVADHCPYCERVLNEFLIPMTRNRDYDAKVVMRRIETRSPRALRGFDGRPTSHREFAGRNGARFTPTVMLFSPSGKPLGQPMVGLTTPDYYGYFLDQAIDEAVAQVRAGKP